MCRKRSCATGGRGRRPTSAAVCRIPCLILWLAYVESVCKCRAPNSPGGLNGRIASVIASLFSSSRPPPPARASYLEHLILPTATATTPPTPAAVPLHCPRRRAPAAAATRPRAWRARSAWPETWPLSSASIRIRATRPPAASSRACASHAARYTATSCRISAVLTAPLNTRWLARPSVAHSPAARAAPAGVTTTTVKRPPFGPGAVWRSIPPLLRLPDPSPVGERMAVKLVRDQIRQRHHPERGDIPHHPIDPVREVPARVRTAEQKSTTARRCEAA